MGEGRDLSGIMRNENETLPIFIELGKALGQSLSCGLVEAGIGLIEQEKLGGVDPCTR